MKYQLIVLLALGCAVTSKDYDDDEGRPYEFGFTIDGQQHRRESKDINGIIMGEFGFITADGVYHVTVYATDENGAFKILSMRNIKVSEPLDTPGYKFPSKVPSGNPRPIKEISTTIRTTISTTTTTTPKAPYRFTTVPSLNVPACSSCALPSTTPSPPGAPPNNKLPFQTPAFQPGYKPGTKPDVQNNGIFNAPVVQNQFDKPLVQVPVGPVQKPNVDQPFGQVPAYNDLPNLPKPADIQRPPYNNQNVIPPIQNVIPPLQNVIPPHKPVRAPADEPPKVTVANGMIQIPGKVPIPIKDKYPNMQEGLPAGITKDDMLDLLYKFNYTLGFHGHHEKGLKDGTKIGGYFVNGRDGISRVVEYIADKNGYRPKVKFINLGLDSPLTPREGTEKTFGLQGFEFVWYPI